MFAHAFRFEPFKANVFKSAFQARMRSSFAPRKPRHRVLRVVLGMVGVAVLAVLVMAGLFVGAAMIAAGVAYKLLKPRGKPMAGKADGHRDVLDAQYRVVDTPAMDSLSLPR